MATLLLLLHSFVLSGLNVAVKLSRRTEAGHEQDVRALTSNGNPDTFEAVYLPLLQG